MLCSLPVLLEEARLRVGALSVGRAELLEVFSWDRETVGVRVREVSSCGLKFWSMCYNCMLPFRGVTVKMLSSLFLHSSLEAFSCYYVILHNRS